MDGGRENNSDICERISGEDDVEFNKKKPGTMCLDGGDN